MNSNFNLSAEDQKLYDDNKAAVDARYEQLIAEEQQNTLDSNEESGVVAAFDITPERQEELFRQALQESGSSVRTSSRKTNSKDAR